MNIAPFLPLEDMQRKLDALRRHCRAAGRQFETLRLTYFGFVNLSGRPSGRTDLHIVEGARPTTFWPNCRPWRRSA